MVYLPIAGQYLTPFEALTTMVVMDAIGPLPNMPKAIKYGHIKDIGRLGAGMFLGLPLGVYALTLVAPEVFRFGVSLSTMVLLVLLVSGVRYTRTLAPPMIVTTGGLGGFLAGSVGLAGPPVILLYMAAPHPASAIRANITLYLLLSDAAMLVVLAFFGELVLGAVGLGFLVAVPYLIGNVMGGRMFRPGAENTYRTVAYLVIAASAISGLPIFD